MNTVDDIIEDSMNTTLTTSPEDVMAILANIPLHHWRWSSVGLPNAIEAPLAQARVVMGSPGILLMPKANSTFAELASASRLRTNERSSVLFSWGGFDRGDRKWLQQMFHAVNDHLLEQDRRALLGLNEDGTLRRPREPESPAQGNLREVLLKKIQTEIEESPNAFTQPGRMSIWYSPGSTTTKRGSDDPDNNDDSNDDNSP